MYLKEWKYRPSLFEQTRREYQAFQGESSIEKFGAFSHFVSQCRMNKDYTKREEYRQ